MTTDRCGSYVNRITSHKRCIYKATGKPNEALNKPFVGIASCYSDISPATAGLRRITDSIKNGIWQSGGTPFEFGIPHTCGMVAVGTNEIKYELLLRDVVAASIETVTRIHAFDALVLVGSCDNGIAGLLLAASRLALPTIVVSAGPMELPSYNPSDLTDAIFSGNADSNEINKIEEAACSSYGACPIMGTATSMQIISEVLGLSLPGSTLLPDTSSYHLHNAHNAGRAIVKLWRDGTTAKLLMKQNFRNAMVVSMAIGASTNVILHFLSMARELSLMVKLDDFDAISDTTPLICGVKPNGSYTATDLFYAGGVPALLHVLNEHIEASNNPLSEFTTKMPIRIGEVVRVPEEAFSSTGGLVVLKGNLAPRGAIIRASSIGNRSTSFNGPAKVYNTDEDASNAVNAGEICPGDCIVVRYEGPQGSPGMKEVILTSYAIQKHGLGRDVAIVTDGRFSGFNEGFIVGHVCPEAYIGGLIALVKCGDIISIDIDSKEIRLCVSDEIISERRKNCVRPTLDNPKGFLSIYRKTALQADEGAAMQL